MIISLRWLQDFVDVNDCLLKPDALAEVLTGAGLEVENITQHGKDLQFVVTALILEKAKHPQADRLSVCRVSTGDGVVHQIVCGAQNHQTNDRVVLALPGAILPGNFAIQGSQIRGIESGGMLCSEKELGLATESPGILILPQDAPLGKPFAEYAGLDDVTFELKVTPNRADCLSHYGLAREVAALLGKPLRPCKPEPKISGHSTRAEMAVDVQAADLCPRYAGRFFTQVKVGPSPAWLQKRLQIVGLKSINNIVDVTNYVMLELGQPLHAFDAEEIKGRHVHVRLAPAQTKFQTLDGTDLQMQGDELGIFDDERMLALAGVVGGKNSGVSDATTTVFLESAYFLPSTVRQTARRFGISTDASYRFSRGVDPHSTVLALDRASELLLQVAGGFAYGEHHDLYPKPLVKSPISLELSLITQRLGYPAEESKLLDFLPRLGCQVESLGLQKWQILPPSYRFDLEQDVDLVEEYARLNGFDLIPETIPAADFPPTAHDKVYLHSQALNKICLSSGFDQALNLAFTSEKEQQDLLQDLAVLNDLGLPVSAQPVKLLNPLSEQMNAMRSTLSFGLLNNVLFNCHQGNEVGALFENGKVFLNESSAESPYRENWRLGLVQWGQRQGLWQKGAPAYPLVFELKATLEGVLASLQITDYQWQTSAQGRPAFLHAGQWAALLVENKSVGFIGSVHPGFCEEHKIRVPVVIAEINLDLLLARTLNKKAFRPLCSFPVVERDMALVMQKDLPAQSVVHEIRQLAGSMLLSTEVFDLYTGDNLPDQQKSLAFRLRFQDPNGTLQDAAVQQLMQTVRTGLEQKFSLTLR